jgi:hypothetical protein
MESAQMPRRKPDPDTVRAIVIDPERRRIDDIRVSLRGLIADEDHDEWLTIHEGELMLVDGGDHERMDDFFYYAEDDAPTGGVVVIVGFDPQTDIFRDTRLSVEKVRGNVRWWRRGEKRPAGTWTANPL